MALMLTLPSLPTSLSRTRVARQDVLCMEALPPAGDAAWQRTHLISGEIPTRPEPALAPFAGIARTQQQEFLVFLLDPTQWWDSRPSSKKPVHGLNNCYTTDLQLALWGIETRRSPETASTFTPGSDALRFMQARYARCEGNFRGRKELYQALLELACIICIEEGRIPKERTLVSTFGASLYHM